MAVDQDGTAGTYLPSSAAQWTEQLSGLALAGPVALYPFQDAATPAVDVIGAKNLAAPAPANVSFLQTVAGYSRKSVKTAGTSVDSRLINNTYADVSAASYTIYVLARVAAPSVTRTIVRIGGAFNDDATLEVSATPRLLVGEGDGTRSTGASDPTGAVHWFVLRVGAQVDGFVDGVKVAGGARACNGTELCLGGDNFQTYYSAVTDYLYMAVFGAEHSDGEVATVLGRFVSGPPIAAPVTLPPSYASTPEELKGLLDLAFDPLTRDLIDSDDGGLVETTDSRTAVLWQMECEHGAWWGDATQGSRISAIIRGEIPGEMIDVVDEVKRCLQPLVTEGIIADLQVSLDEDEAQRPVVLILYRDRSSGSLVDIAYVPFNL